MNVFSFAAALNEDMAEVARLVQRSLVVVHNGKRGAGAGVVWREGSFIITNYHVVAQRNGRTADNLRVTLPDNREVPARLLADAPHLDLALLQVEPEDLAPVAIADSTSLKVGQMVFAIGHPWGQRGYVTGGVISSLGVAYSSNGNGSKTQTSVPILRSDVQLAPGNSGGPLVDAAGNVVGINTMVVGGDQGVAIPSHIVESFVRQSLVSTGIYIHGSAQDRSGDWM